MLKIPTQLLKKIKPLYCKTVEQDNKPTWCNRETETIDTSSFAFSDEVEFCRYFKDNHFTDVENKSKTLDRIDDDCKAILAKHNSSSNSHQGHFTLFNSIGLFFLTIDEDDLLDIWTAGINKWKSAITDGYNFLQSGIMAADAFHKTWNQENAPQTQTKIKAKTDSRKPQDGVRVINSSLLLEQADILKRSLADFTEAVTRTSISQSQNQSGFKLNSSKLVKALEHSDVDELIDSIGNQSTYSAIQKLDSAYEDWTNEYVLPVIVGQFRALRAAINEKDKLKIENNVASIEATSDVILEIDRLFSKYSQNLINTIRQAEGIASFSTSKDSKKLQELRGNLTLNEFPNTANKLRNILTSVINIRLLLKSNMDAKSLTVIFDGIDNLAKDEDASIGSQEFIGDNPKTSIKKIKLLIASIDNILSAVSRKLNVDFQAADNYLDIAKLGSLSDNLRNQTSYSAIMDILNLESTYSTIQELNDHYTNWALDYIIPEIVSQAKQLRLAFENNNVEAIETRLARFNIIISDLNLIGQKFHNFIQQLEIVIEEELGKSDSKNLSALKQELTALRGILHDINNLLTTSFSINSLYEAGLELDEFEYAFDAIDGFDLTTLSSNIRTAVKFQSYAANKKMVNVIIEDNIPVVENMPNDIKHLVLRMVSESILNSIKYSDEEKLSKKVTVSVAQRNQLIDIVVEDNGVGIINVEGVLELGGRERPDLANGTGTGLTTLSALANKIGLTISVKSTPGIGTTVSLKGINPSKWKTNTIPSDNINDKETDDISKRPFIASSSFAGFIPDINSFLSSEVTTEDETPIDPLNPSIPHFINATQLSMFIIQPTIIGTTSIKTTKSVR